MKKKFVVVGAMAGTLIFTQSALAAGLAVTPSKNTLSVQTGEGVQTVEAVPAYLYQDNNYFKLRDLVEIMDFTCGWDSEKNRIQLSTGEQNDEGVSISVKDFLVEGAKQKVIEEDVPYIPGTKDYAALEAYMQKNVDKDFKASDFIITEAEEGSNTPNLITLDMRLNVNGVMTKNFGYRVLCINKKAALITFIGEKNPDFDITKAGVQKLSDADAKQMALDMDKNSYKAEKQTVSRYFDMQELKQKCEVETTYIDNGGATFVTAHAFDAE